MRLLKIENALPNEALECELWSWALVDTDLPEYVACSYTWGLNRFDTPIQVNGFPFHVTAHLEAALRRLRRFGRRWCWVDQIW